MILTGKEQGVYWEITTHLNVFALEIDGHQ
jgi:hypothetical protein